MQEHRYRQISPGAFRGSLLHTQTGSLGIFRNRWERAIHYRGTPPEGTIGLAIPLAQSGKSIWNLQPAGFNDLIVQRCGTESELLSTSLWEAVLFTIPEAGLAQQITDITHDDPEAVLHGLDVARLTPQMSAQVRHTCTAYIDAAAQSLARPDAPLLLQEMATSLAELMAHALVSSSPSHGLKPSFNRQRRLINKAEDYRTHHTNQPLRIGKLCRELDISERTLRDAFHKLVGKSPLDYLKTERLSRVYRTLVDADPTKVLIKQIAHSNGFIQPGQFSRDYKHLFGELPSETLQRG